MKLRVGALMEWILGKGWEDAIRHPAAFLWAVVCLFVFLVTLHSLRACVNS